MSESYYKQKIYLAEVDKEDKILGKVERWLAHERGTLHRGFTVILSYQNQIVLQHRKHVAFDGIWDMTFSSHSFYQGDNLTSDLEAITLSLGREWNVGLNDLVGEPILKGKVYYQAKDPKSIFTEHEIDYIHTAELKKLPNPNLDYAYGFELIDFDQVKRFNLAPWVQKIYDTKIKF